MVSLISIFKAPEDRAQFDAHYDDIHTPLVKQMDGIRKLEVSRIVKMLTPATSTIAEQPYLVCTMYFDDRAALDNAMRSPGGKAAAKDLMGFAGSLVSMVTADVANVDL